MGPPYTQMQPVIRQPYTQMQPAMGQPYTQIQPVMGQPYTQMQPVMGQPYTQIQPVMGPPYTQMQPVMGIQIFYVEVQSAVRSVSAVEGGTIEQPLEQGAMDGTSNKSVRNRRSDGSGNKG
jgi:hypothetical protein